MILFIISAGREFQIFTILRGGNGDEMEGKGREGRKEGMEEGKKGRKKGSKEGREIKENYIETE